MVIHRHKLALLGVAALALVFAISWPVDYCGGRSEVPTTPVQQFAIPACTLGSDVLELNDLGARAIVDGQRLYLLDAARAATIVTQYRIDRGALGFTSEVTGHSVYRDFPQAAGTITHIVLADEPGWLRVLGDTSDYKVAVARANGELTLFEPVAETRGRQPQSSSAMTPMQCDDFDALTVIPSLNAVAIFSRR